MSKFTPYEQRRMSFLGDIFEFNHEIWDDIDPFSYDRDVYDTLLLEQYVLYDGGDNAIEWAKEQSMQVRTLIDEYYLEGKIKDMCEELSQMYLTYINQYANKKGEDEHAED